MFINEVSDWLCAWVLLQIARGFTVVIISRKKHFGQNRTYEVLEDGRRNMFVLNNIVTVLF